MKGIRLTALAGALIIIIVAGWLPAAGAHGQSRGERASPSPARVRAFDFTRGSRIGVTVQDVEDSDAKQAKSGVIVESVDTGGPAEKAGVKAGDAITEFDGERVRSVRQFSRLVQETPSGRSVAVALSRGGQRVTVNVTTESNSFNEDFSYRLLETVRPAIPAAPTPPAPPRALPAPFEGLRIYTRGRLGVTLETLDDQLAQYFGVKEGVLVKSVADDSAAQKAGVKAGDVITSVNGRRVYETSDVNRAMDRTESTDEFTLEITRDKKPLTLKGKLETTRPRGRGAMHF
jgi:serine protease Do